MGWSNYVKITGITFLNPTPTLNASPPCASVRFFDIEASSHNEITNSVFDAGFSGSYEQVWDGNTGDCAAADTTGICSHPSTQNWIHNNTFRNSAGTSCTASCTGSASCTCSGASCSCPQATSVDCSSGTSCIVIDPNGTSTCTQTSLIYSGGVQIGVPDYDGSSGSNTIENDTFYCGGHHNLEVYSRYDVVRNNFFHNEGCSTSGLCSVNGNFIGRYPPDYNGQWGGRNVQLPAEGWKDPNNTGVYLNEYDLNEGNRYGASGQPPDTDGGDGLTISGPGAIHRFNSIVNAQNNGILLKVPLAGLLPNYNHIYNNTVYHSARWQPGNLASVQWQGGNLRWYISNGTYGKSNCIINNIFYGYGPVQSNDGTGGVASGATTASGSDFSSNTYAGVLTSNTVSNNWCTVVDSYGECSGHGDPIFVAEDTNWSDSLSNPVFPDLHLQAASPAIRQGTYLTTANGSGSSSITLVVNDAMYFQDGSWGSSLAQGSHNDDCASAGYLTNGMAASCCTGAGTGTCGFFPDQIAIGTVSNVVQISSVVYNGNPDCTASGVPYSCCSGSGAGTCTANTITLASPMTWASGAPIWLYTKSDGTRVLYGSAPDLGAYESQTSVLPTVQHVRIVK
jgi:hypothetical protein